MGFCAGSSATVSVFVWRTLFCTGAMLMCLDDGNIHKKFLQFGIKVQTMENIIQNVIFNSFAEAVVNGFPGGYNVPEDHTMEYRFGQSRPFHSSSVSSYLLNLMKTPLFFNFIMKKAVKVGWNLSLKEKLRQFCWSDCISSRSYLALRKVSFLDEGYGYVWTPDIRAARLSYSLVLHTYIHCGKYSQPFR